MASPRRPSHSSSAVPSRKNWKLCRLDHGCIQFEFPPDWIVKKEPDKVHLHDLEPPGDNCELIVSRFYHPEDLDFDGLPLRDLFDHSTQGIEKEVLEQKPVVEVRRMHLQLCWQDTRFIEQTEKREARSITCLARGQGMHALLTYCYWQDCVARFEGVWRAVLETLRVGTQYMDPTKGVAIRAYQRSLGPTGNTGPNRLM